MKKETLEEFALKYADGNSWNTLTIESVKAGAKWQAERMYTEEEVMTIFFLGRESLNKALITQEEALDIIKQFKKK